MPLRREIVDLDRAALRAEAAASSASTGPPRAARVRGLARRAALNEAIAGSWRDPRRGMADPARDGDRSEMPDPGPPGTRCAATWTGWTSRSRWRI
jgi:UDP-N-acetylglucosamine--N-acetylmuramyl-(pentapeptide) pyrophosphoryl-undecaprenol N-acetylglucosamine transferase